MSMPNEMCTLYIRNLNENIKLPLMKQALKAIYENYGKVIDIIAYKNIRMRGQAFVILDKAENAKRALQDTQGFPLFDQILDVQFSKTPSDAIIKIKEGEKALELHIRKRRALKEQKQLIEEKKKSSSGVQNNNNNNNNNNNSNNNKKPKTANQKINDDYLPPNKILFLQGLPEDADEDALTAVFQNFPGFQEVRIVPGRKGLAFVEYLTETDAISAKANTNGLVLEEKTIKITYARK